VPLGALLVSDVILNTRLGYPMVDPQMISRYAVLAVVVGIGVALRVRPRLVTALPASIVGSVIFFVVTNTGSWIGSAAYAHTFGGWVQALTTGLPGYEPTWMFFRSSLISDLAFTALFVVCMAAAPGREELPAGALASAGR
jgi:hypothetical protein